MRNLSFEIYSFQGAVRIFCVGSLSILYKKSILSKNKYGDDDMAWENVFYVRKQVELRNGIICEGGPYAKKN